MKFKSNISDYEKQRKRLFWITYLTIIVIVIARGSPLEVPFWNIWNDDTMRLVQVRDLLNGQNWFDLIQYRLGVDGTPMHWSRLIDLPLAVLIGFFSIFMSVEWAEATTMVLWPILLIGPTLGAIYIASIRYGGESAGIFGLIFGAMAIIASEKFDPGSLDHHNVQLMLTAIVVMAMMGTKDTMKNGVIAGVTCALSLTIGLETMLFVVGVSASVALIWVIYGDNVRIKTIGFTGGFVAIFIIVFIVTRPELTISAFNCDSFGSDLLIVGVAGAAGLLFLALTLSLSPAKIRVLGLLALSGTVLIVSIRFAPACLENPLNQLYPDVRSEWLGRIVESQSLLESITSSIPGNFGLLVTPVIAGMYVLLIARNSLKRPASIVLFVIIASAYFMTFYQIRGMNFLILLSVVPIAAILGHLHGRYKITRNPGSGVLVIIAVLVSIPDVWSIGYISLPRSVQLSPSTQIEKTETDTVTERFETCRRPEDLLELAAMPVGFIVSSTDLGTILLSATPHKILSSNFHRNQDGIQSGLDLAKTDMAGAYAQLQSLGVDYVVLCKIDNLPLRLSYDNPEGLWSALYAGNAPEFLELATDPNALIVAYKVLP